MMITRWYVQVRGGAPRARARAGVLESFNRRVAVGGPRVSQNQIGAFIDSIVTPIQRWKSRPGW